MDFIIRNLANILTLGNLFCGFAGIINTLYGDPVTGAWFIIWASLFDFSDGFVAKKLKQVSSIGKQLDSLADVVSFGILPAAILHVLLIKSHIGWVYQFNLTGIPIVSFLPFIFAAAAALRLAKFNIDDEQKNVFKGLPAPAAGLFVASLPLIMKYDLYLINYQSIYLEKVLFHPVLLLSVAILLSWWMLSNIRLFSLKFNNFGWKDNQERYILLAGFVLFFVMFYFLAIPLIIILYGIISITNKKKLL